MICSQALALSSTLRQDLVRHSQQMYATTNWMKRWMNLKLVESGQKREVSSLARKWPITFFPHNATKFRKTEFGRFLSSIFTIFTISCTNWISRFPGITELYATKKIHICRRVKISLSRFHHNLLSIIIHCQHK